MGMILPILGRFWWLPVVIVLSLATLYYKHAYNASEARYVVFEAKVEALGEAAKVAAKKEELKHEQAISAAVAGRDVARKRLREQIAGAGSVPSEPIAPAGVADLRGITPAEFERAYEKLARELSGIAQEGDEAVIDSKALWGGWPR